MASLSYTVRGLSSGHQMVFKSMVELCHGRGKHRWQYIDSDHADVLVLGSEPLAHDLNTENRVVVGIGPAHESRALHIHLPLLFPKISPVMDAAGDVCWQLKISADPSLAQKADSTSIRQSFERTLDERHRADAAANMVHSPLLHSQPPSILLSEEDAAQHKSSERKSSSLYRLHKWPPVDIISKHPSNMRLATLLTGRPSTAADLAQRANASMDVCRAFLVDLHHAKCLDVQRDSHAHSGFLHLESSTAKPKAENLTTSSRQLPTGLFQRIRSKLGLVGKTA